MDRCERCGCTITQLDDAGVLRCSVCKTPIEDHSMQQRRTFLTARKRAMQLAKVGDYDGTCVQVGIMAGADSSSPEIYSLPLNALMNGYTSGLFKLNNKMIERARRDFIQLGLAGGNAAVYQDFWRRYVCQTLESERQRAQRCLVYMGISLALIIAAFLFFARSPLILLVVIGAAVGSLCILSVPIDLLTSLKEILKLRNSMSTPFLLSC